MRVITHRVPRQGYIEQIALLLASNDPMDVIAGIQVPQFQPKGAIKAINLWLDQIPNTRKAWTDIAWSKVSTVDGQTWAIPRGEVVTAWPVWIRGVPAPIRPGASSENVLEVFLQNDPIGGGQQVMITSYAPHLRMAGGWLPDGYGPWLDSSDNMVKPPAPRLPRLHRQDARLVKGYIWPDSFNIPASETGRAGSRPPRTGHPLWGSASTPFSRTPRRRPGLPAAHHGSRRHDRNPQSRRHAWLGVPGAVAGRKHRGVKVFGWQYSDVENYHRQEHRSGVDGLRVTARCSDYQVARIEFWAIRSAVSSCGT